ncbi:MAG: hypothetical protein K2X93_18120 [Candidatus Obscuribacterales bacterium]|nr:hypothetical protein [Candidatus Obscuribacterales bacterium]
MIRRTFSAFLILNLIVTPSFAATDLEGKVDTTQLATDETDTQRQPLQGGVKNEASLNPSLKVIPGQKAKANLKSEIPKYFYPNGAKLTQYRGSAPVFSSGEPTEYPMLRSQSPTLAPSPRVWHIIPSVSSYTMTPRNGIMSWVDGYGESNSTNSRTLANYRPAREVVQRSSVNGITSYAPGYDVQQSTACSGITQYDSPRFPAPQFSPAQIARMFGERLSAPVSIAHNGITSYAPGYDAISLPPSRKGITSFGPERKIDNGTMGSANGSRTPAYAVAINTPKNGVVCWDSRYESSVASNGLIKETTDGMWSSPVTRPESNIVPTTQELANKPLFVQPVVDMEHPLRAQTLPLGGIEKSAVLAAPEEKMSWDEWYKRVARAIYARWQNANVGPGAARVVVTVTRDRELYGRVTEFWPAQDVARDVDDETDFKSDALKSINLVSSFEIPEFPDGADVPSVSFEVDLKRQVDGPTGFDVAGVVDGKAPMVPTKKVTAVNSAKRK